MRSVTHRTRAEGQRPPLMTYPSVSRKLRHPAAMTPFVAICTVPACPEKYAAFAELKACVRVDRPDQVTNFAIAPSQMPTVPPRPGVSR